MIYNEPENAIVHPDLRSGNLDDGYFEVEHVVGRPDSPTLGDASILLGNPSPAATASRDFGDEGQVPKVHMQTSTIVSTTISRLVSEDTSVYLPADANCTFVAERPVDGFDSGNSNGSDEQQEPGAIHSAEDQYLPRASKSTYPLFSSDFQFLGVFF